MTKTEAERFSANAMNQITGMLGMLDHAVNVVNVPGTLRVPPRDWVASVCPGWNLPKLYWFLGI